MKGSGKIVPEELEDYKATLSTQLRSEILISQCSSVSLRDVVLCN